MARLDELKKEVLELEAKAKAQESTEHPQEPAPADAEEADQAMVRGVFAKMRLTPEEIAADEDERVARENAVSKACLECYLCQPIENEVCDLCRHEPDRWLPSVERSPRQNRVGDIVDDNGNAIVPSSRASGTHVKAHAGRRWLRWASTHATVNELTYVVSRFSSPDVDWKVKHAALVLKLRGAPIPPTFWGKTVDFGEPPSRHA